MTLYWIIIYLEQLSKKIEITYLKKVVSFNDYIYPVSIKFQHACVCTGNTVD